MPELPDVEIRKRYIDATSLHQTIEHVALTGRRMLHGATAGTLRRRTRGASFDRTERHGKHLFVELGGDGWLMLHFGMTGELAYVGNPSAEAKDTDLTIRFENGGRLDCRWRRKLGRIELVETPDRFVREHELGPDALSPALKLPDFRRMLTNRRGAVKSALMDQHFIAGIGNIYSDEMLFQARIHPRTAARGLENEETAALYRAMWRVLRIAVQRKAEPDRMPASWLLPQRAGASDCPRCGGRLDRIAFAGRTALVCPACQPERK